MSRGGLHRARGWVGASGKLLEGQSIKLGALETEHCSDCISGSMGVRADTPSPSFSHTQLCLAGRSRRASPASKWVGGRGVHMV